MLPQSFQPYATPPGFGVVTCYFNPSRYRSKVRNYHLFRESLRESGIPCLTVECLFPGQSPELPASDDVHTVIARDTMWQKGAPAQSRPCTHSPRLVHRRMARLRYSLRKSKLGSRRGSATGTSRHCSVVLLKSCVFPNTPHGADRARSGGKASPPSSSERPINCSREISRATATPALGWGRSPRRPRPPWPL